MTCSDEMSQNYNFTLQSPEQDCFSNFRLCNFNSIDSQLHAKSQKKLMSGFTDGTTKKQTNGQERLLRILSLNVGTQLFQMR